MTDLVYMKDGEGTTDSLKVAEHFGKKHQNVLRKIERIIDAGSLDWAPNGAECFRRSRYQDASGKWNTVYLMNRDGFMFLVMGFTGRKADEWRWKFIDAFNRMEQYIRQHDIELLLRRTMTDEIRDSGENERMHGFAYKQYTDLAYKIATGKTAKQMRDELGLKKTGSIKEHLDPAQVEAIGNAEYWIGAMLKMHLVYPAIKEEASRLAVARIA